MYALIGYDHLYDEFAREDNGGTIVALFTSKILAEKYEKASRLKSFKKYTYCADAARQYRKNSLLHFYRTADIEEYVSPEYIIDPKLK